MGAMRESSSMWARICFAPSAQLIPTLSSGASETEIQKASMVGPESVRPLRSTMVTEAMQRQAFARVLEILLGGKERGFAVERVEDGFHQKQVNAALHETPDLLVVGVS